jgi:hypothetical protein
MESNKHTKELFWYSSFVDCGKLAVKKEREDISKELPI